MTSVGPSIAMAPSPVTSRVPRRSMTTTSAAMIEPNTSTSCVGRRPRRGTNASTRTETTAAPNRIRIGAIA